SLMYYGQNGVVTRRAARTLSDFKDMRIRDSGGDMQQLMLRALGIVGLPMPLDQVLPALQQGAIEGVMMTIPAATTLKLYDAAKYFTDFAVSTVTAIVVINKSWFDKLPLDLQKIVASDGQTVGRELLPFTLNFTEQENNAWKAGGGEIVHLPASDASQMRSLEGNVPGRVIEGKPDLKQFYDLLVKTAQKYR